MINQSSDKKKLWNGKLTEKLLLTMIMADLKQFVPKFKQVICTGAFFEFYNEKNGRQVHKIYRMIKFEKMHALTVENPYNFGAY